jgi:hypothetical protein
VIHRVVKAGDQEMMVLSRVRAMYQVRCLFELSQLPLRTYWNVMIARYLGGLYYALCRWDVSICKWESPLMSVD